MPHKHLNLQRVLLLLRCIGSGCGANRNAQTTAQDAPKFQIERVLAAQAEAWNRGDLDAFMEGYAKLPTLPLSHRAEA